MQRDEIDDIHGQLKDREMTRGRKRGDDELCPVDPEDKKVSGGNVLRNPPQLRRE